MIVQIIKSISAVSVKSILFLLLPLLVACEERPDTYSFSQINQRVINKAGSNAEDCGRSISRGNDIDVLTCFENALANNMPVYGMLSSDPANDPPVQSATGISITANGRVFRAFFRGKLHLIGNENSSPLDYVVSLSECIDPQVDIVNPNRSMSFPFNCTSRPKTPF